MTKPKGKLTSTIVEFFGELSQAEHSEALRLAGLLPERHQASAGHYVFRIDGKTQVNSQHNQAEKLRILLRVCPGKRRIITELRFEE